LFYAFIFQIGCAESKIYTKPCWTCFVNCHRSSLPIQKTSSGVAVISCGTDNRQAGWWEAPINHWLNDITKRKGKKNRQLMLLIVATFYAWHIIWKRAQKYFSISLVLYAFIIANALRWFIQINLTFQCLEMQMVPSGILRYWNLSPKNLFPKPLIWIFIREDNCAKSPMIYYIGIRVKSEKQSPPPPLYYLT
jgi:hypothetical protein